MRKIIFLLLLLSSTLNVVDAQSIKLIPNNDTSDAGFSNNSVKIWNNGAVSLYTKKNGKIQLAYYKNDQLNYISNPDTGGTIIGGASRVIVFKNSIFFGYKNNSGDTLLVSYDGISTSFIPNPNSDLIPKITSGIGLTHKVNNNRLFILFYSKTSKMAVTVEYDSFNFRIYRNPSNFNYSFVNFLSYNDSLFMILNNSVIGKIQADSILLLKKTIQSYLFYPEDNVIFDNKFVTAAKGSGFSEYNLVLFDGDSTTKISNPNWAVFTSQLVFVRTIEYKKNIYRPLKISASGKFEISKYDGVGYSRISNPDTSGTTDNNLVEYNKLLFFMYKKSLSQTYYQLAKFDSSTISLINSPDTLGDYYPYFTFNSKLHLIYFYKKSGSATTYKKLAFYDSGKITLISNPDTGIGFTQYYDTTVKRIYFTYQNAQNKFQLAFLDFEDSSKSTLTGNIITPLKKVIKNCELQVTSGTTFFNQQTNGEGYNFTVNKNNNYTLRPTKNNDISKNNGVSAIDIILTQNHILDKIKLNSPYKIIAADVNGNNSVSNIDIIFMKRLILGIDTTFTGNRLWAFVDSAYVFPDTTNPFPYKDSISFSNLTSNKINQSFIGVKLGDVNYDWNPAIARNANTQAVELVYEEPTLNINEIIRVPISVNNFKELVGIQYTLHFNHKDYEFVSIEDNRLGIDYNDKRVNINGNISFLWSDAKSEAKNLGDGTRIMTVVLRKKHSNCNVELDLTNSITEIEAWDKDYQMHNIILTKRETPINNLPLTIDQWTVSPNPTDGNITINTIVQQNKKFVFEVSNAEGKIILRETVELTKGQNKININLKKQSNITAGVYFIKAVGLETNNVKKIMVQ